MRMFPEPFFGVTTMGAHHSVTFVTGAIIFCLSNTSSSVLSLSCYMNGIIRGVPTQKGLAFSVSDMWNSSPIMVLICPSKTLGNSLATLSSVNGLGVGGVTVSFRVGSVS